MCSILNSRCLISLLFKCLQLKRQNQAAVDAWERAGCVCVCRGTSTVNKTLLSKSTDCASEIDLTTDS